MQIVEAPPSAEAKRSRGRGQCGGLRKFKTLFTLRAERLFATLGLSFLPSFSSPPAGVHPPDVCTGFALVTRCLFIYSYADGIAGAEDGGEEMVETIPVNFLRRCSETIERRDLSAGNAHILFIRINIKDGICGSVRVYAEDRYLASEERGKEFLKLTLRYARYFDYRRWNRICSYFMCILPRVH